MLNLGLSFDPILLVILYILIILLEDSLEKAFLILIISLILSSEACVYNLLFDFRAKFGNWFL